MTTERRRLEANGLTFDLRESGPTDGEPVLLLHGFPETSRMWEGLMESLAHDGKRCAAPNLRGYSAGARPTGAEHYRYEALVADVFGIADALGFEQFHLVAHDWGAGVAWALLATDGSRVASFTSLSIPHYRAFAEAVRDDPDEEAYRRMMDSFLRPGAAEALAADSCAGLRTAWTSHTADEIDDYVSVFSEPGALQAALNYYIACDRHARALDGPLEFGPVSTPTLLLWGTEDFAIRRRSVDAAEAYMTGAYRRVDLDAGHWVVQEQPDRVNAEISAFLAEYPIP